MSPAFLLSPKLFHPTLPLERPSGSDFQMEALQGGEGDGKKMKVYRGVRNKVMNRKQCKDGGMFGR